MWPLRSGIYASSSRWPFSRLSRQAVRGPNTRTDNPITSADDAFGLTLGLESVGIYSPGLVRGFSPITAGNVRIDGMYFDLQGSPSDRVVEGSTIRVGVSEIGYAFPAPTGIVDFNLRNVGGDTPTATIIANVGPYEAWGISIDGSLPLIGKELVLPIGVSTQVSTQSPYGSYPGLTSRVTSAGASPQWTPNAKITVRALIDWQETSDAKTLPRIFHGRRFPSSLDRQRLRRAELGQGPKRDDESGWPRRRPADRRMVAESGRFSIDERQSGEFCGPLHRRPTEAANPSIWLSAIRIKTRSTSGEMRLTGTFTTGDWRHQLIFMTRGRDTTTRYGGEDAVDVGPATIGTIVQAPEPDFSIRRARSTGPNCGASGLRTASTGAVRACSRWAFKRKATAKRSTSPGTAESEVTAHPFRAYANAAFAVTPQLTLYAGYTQGLENSGVAPNSAQNSGAVLPASLTWQVDSGARYAVTPKLKIIAGVFELQEALFQFGYEQHRSRTRRAGGQGHRTLRCGRVDRGLPRQYRRSRRQGRHHRAGSGRRRRRVRSRRPAAPDVRGQRQLHLAWWKAASLDVSATHFGTAPESVDNGVYTPAATFLSIGGRYKFTALGENSTLRLQVQNVLQSKVWTSVYTPGFFQWPGPRTVFAYITTDLQ